MRSTILACVVLLLWLAPVRAQFPEEVKGSIAFVNQLQTKSGGYITAPPPAGVKVIPTLRDTSAAIRALKYLGAEVKDKDACKQFVEKCWHAEGGFANTPGGKPDVFTTAIGIMAVVELGLPVEKYADGVVKYLDENAKTFDEIRIAVAGLERLGRKGPATEKWSGEVLKLRNTNGTFGKDDGLARDTGSGVVTLLRLGVASDNRPTVLQALNAGQRLSGGFGKEKVDRADLETSYRVMRCYHMLKAQPEGEEALRTFVAKCRNSDGGYAISPGEPSTVGATYFAIILQHWLKKE